MSSSSAPSSRSNAAVRSACRASPSCATTKRTVCWTRSRTSADEEPGERERRPEDQGAQHSRRQQQDEQQQERPVLLVRTPGILHPRRKQPVYDICTVERRDRNEIEDCENAVPENDRGEDLFIRAADHRSGTEPKRQRAKRGQSDVRYRARERDERDAHRRSKARLIEWNGFPVAKARENEEQRAEGVEVRHGIEAQAAEEPRRVVA